MTGLNEGHPGVAAPGILEDSAGIPITNENFVRTFFADDWWRAYVTGFADDPSSIVPERRGLCWSGTAFHKANGQLDPSNNQFICISGFNDVDGKAVRRKSQFVACYLIIIDDVGTKVPWHVADKFPPPSYKLETSPGNWQWGYGMPEGQPELERWKPERLLDGLVAKGITEDGKDPGMKGVTRLGRLPEGINNKRKYVDELGEPWRCRMTYWAPHQRYTMDRLADLFGVELVEPEQEARQKGSGVWPDSAPVMAWLDSEGEVLDDKGDGEYLIVCPWVDEHTDGDTSGTWIRTLEDGSGEFKCHHGHCQDRGFNDFLEQTELKFRHDAWRAFRDVAPAPAPAAPERVDRFDFFNPPQAGAPGEAPAWREYIDGLPEDPTSDTAHLQRVIEAIGQLAGIDRGAATAALKARCRGHIPARDIEAAVRNAARGLLQGPEQPVQGDVLDQFIFIESTNKYFRRSTNTLLSPPAFDSTHAHIEFWGPPGPFGDPARLKATEAFDQRLDKRVANALGWQPTRDDMFRWGQTNYANSYQPPAIEPKPGQVGRWLWLMRGIYGEHWELVVQHMAFTVQRPDQKIRWQLFAYGRPRSGKTSGVYPLIKILGDAAKSIRNSDLDADWGDHFHRKKVIVIEEVLQSENRDFYNGLKTRLVNSEVESLNIKGGGMVAQQNLYSMYLFSNHAEALHFDEDDEKLLVIHTGFPFENDEQKEAFFNDYYRWVDEGDGVAEIYDHLLNVDLSDFPAGRLPVKTPAYYAASMAGKPDYQRRLVEMIADGEGSFSRPYFYIGVLKAELRAEGYRFGDRGLVSVLKQLGYGSVRGQRKVDGKNVKTPRFWAKGLEGESDVTVYDVFEEWGGFSGDH